jgi:class 3 adenylate cyclase/pimeloyl-ACP methyl ester carboxylesterase
MIPARGSRSTDSLPLSSPETETVWVSTPKTRWAKTIDDAYVAYQDFGEGPITLVVIQGWVSHLEVYWELPRWARFMRRLSERMRILHFDKRGTGMSDRFVRPPDLEARMDDVRAVMDAAGVERSALLGWGDGGPPLAAFFAATHPERTVGLCMDPHIQLRRTHDYPFGDTEEEFEEWVSAALATWGDEVQLFGDEPHADAEDLRFNAKLSRYGATPGGMVALSRMWFETDVRDILPTIRVPTLILSMTESPWAGPEPAAYVAGLIPGAHVANIPGYQPNSPDAQEPYISAIESFLASVQREEEELDRVLATVLFTDIVGSTHKIAASGDRAWRGLIERHHATVRALIDRYHGIEMDTAGDGFFATFDGPARAIRCALSITDAVKPLGIEVRSGLHTGEVERVDAKVGGIAVNIGARICGMAGASEVLVSRTVKDLVAGSGLTFVDRGEHELNGVPGEWQVYAVGGDDRTTG